MPVLCSICARPVNYQTHVTLITNCVSYMIVLLFFHNCLYSVGAISESRHVCSRESEFSPTLRAAGIGKVAEFKPKQDEYVKYKYTKCYLAQVVNFTTLKCAFAVGNSTPSHHKQIIEKCRFRFWGADPFQCVDRIITYVTIFIGKSVLQNRNRIAGSRTNLC